MFELKNENLTVQFSELGGQITSIKDTDGVEYLWQGDPTYWSGQAQFYFRFVEVYEMIGLSLNLQKDRHLQAQFQGMDLCEKCYSKM